MSNPMVADPHLARSVDAVTASSVVAVIFGLLPAIVSVLVGLAALGWYCLCIYESKTCQAMRKRRRLLKAARRRGTHSH